MITVPDGASVAAMRHLAQLGICAGGSTGTNLWGALQLLAEMHAAGQRGSVVTFVADGGERYQHSYYDPEWVEAQGLVLQPYSHTLEQWAAHGVWQPPA